MSRDNYSAKKTIGKGLDQIFIICLSSAFAALLATMWKDITDQDFKVSNVKQVVESISGLVVVLTPVISAVFRMIRNFHKNFFDNGIDEFKRMIKECK
jgi:hypothetical protein